MNRIKLFDKNTSPTQQRLRLMELSGIEISEVEKKKLKPRTLNESSEIDLDEILKEMGYDDIPDREDWIDMVGVRRGELKDLIRKEVKKYFEDSDQSEDIDLNEIIERITKFI